MKYRLAATKSKFYKLAQKYCSELPAMRNTHFDKYRGRSYALSFEAPDTSSYRLYLSTVAGRATLGIEKVVYDDDEIDLRSGKPIH